MTDKPIALAGEPVAWLVTSKRGMARVAWTDKPSAEQIAIAEYDGDTITPLFAAPTPSAPSVPDRRVELYEHVLSAAKMKGYKSVIAAIVAAPAQNGVSVLTDAALEAWFVKQGDGKDQGLHPHYKSAVRDGFSLAIALLQANGATN